jgi:hypothetical protein
MVQDLRRQLVTKRAFDEEEAHKEISRLKKELHFLQRNGGAAAKKNAVSAAAQTKENTAANAFKRPDSGKVNSEAVELKNKITQLERQRLNHNANVLGPLSAMSQSDLTHPDNASQRPNCAARGGDDIGPGFFGGARGAGNVFAGSGAGTVQMENNDTGFIGGGGARADNVSQGYSYSDF